MKYKIIAAIVLIFFPIFCLANLYIEPITKSFYSLIILADINTKAIMLSTVLLLMLIVSLVEAYFLKILLFKEFKKSLKLSLIVNFITTSLGVFVPIRFNLHFGDDIKTTVPILILFFIGSFLIESLFLKILARNYRWKKIILASFCANLASYALLISLFLCLWAIFS